MKRWSGDVKHHFWEPGRTSCLWWTACMLLALNSAWREGYHEQGASGNLLIPRVFQFISRVHRCSQSLCMFKPLLWCTVVLFGRDWLCDSLFGPQSPLDMQNGWGGAVQRTVPSFSGDSRLTWWFSSKTCDNWGVFWNQGSLTRHCKKEHERIERLRMCFLFLNIEFLKS